MNEIKIELENEDLIRYDAELVLKSLKDFIERIKNADEEEKKTLVQLMIKIISTVKKQSGSSCSTFLP
ncbi:MAG: hypothetical protein KAR18_04640 [Spirochaetes bacterium]|nr:hypothetical protein [Spirochaetota bacterium]